MNMNNQQANKVQLEQQPSGNAGWRQSITLELRHRLVYKLVNSIYSPPKRANMCDRRVLKVESEVYDTTNSLRDYNHILNEKIGEIKKELEERRQKQKQQQELLKKSGYSSRSSMVVRQMARHQIMSGIVGNPNLPDHVQQMMIRRLSPVRPYSMMPKRMGQQKHVVQQLLQLQVRKVKGPSDTEKKREILQIIRAYPELMAACVKGRKARVQRQNTNAAQMPPEEQLIADALRNMEI